MIPFRAKLPVLLQVLKLDCLLPKHLLLHVSTSPGLFMVFLFVFLLEKP